MIHPEPKNEDGMLNRIVCQLQARHRGPLAFFSRLNLCGGSLMAPYQTDSRVVAAEASNPFAGA